MKEFLKKHDACEEGYKWAIKECKSLQEVWDKSRIDWLIWLATREGVLKERDLHEFGLFCANQVKHLMKDPRSLAALQAKRDWLDGKIDTVQLNSAAAYAADAAADAAYAATDTKDKIKAEQAKWLRENTKPKFEV